MAACRITHNCPRKGERLVFGRRRLFTSTATPWPSCRGSRDCKPPWLTLHLQLPSRCPPAPEPPGDQTLARHSFWKNHPAPGGVLPFPPGSLSFRGFTPAGSSTSRPTAASQPLPPPAPVAQRGRSRRVIQDSSEGKEVPGRQQVGAIAAAAALLAVFLSCKCSESRHTQKRRAGEPEPRAPWGGSEERPREAGEKLCKAPPGLAPGQLDHSLQRGCSELPQV